VNKIEEAFGSFLTALEVAKLYATAHPRFKKYFDIAFESMQAVLCENEEIVIGIVGDELVFEKEIFFELTKRVKPMISYFKDRKIEKIGFRYHMTAEELMAFIDVLLLRKEEFTKTAQEYVSLAGVKNIMVGKIHGTLEAVASVFSAGEAYTNSLENVTQSMESLLSGQDVDPFDLKFNLLNMMEGLMGQFHDLLKLTAVKRYDIATFRHVLNVSILSMYFSTQLGFDREDVLDIGIAALFHDIGKLYISRKIIQKPDKLTSEEFNKITNHVSVGSEILLKYVDTLGYLPVIVAFEHHLKYNLRGYPKLSFSRPPHFVSLLVSICDVYDALMQRRSYKNDYPPSMIYEIMLKDRGAGFDPKLFDAFYKNMGVWPIGTLVTLSDGSIAVVREENADDIFNPKVEILSPSHSKELIDLKPIHHTIKIERFVSPLKEGKAYLHLI
jgi:putative nucleotidyltransferase with HDIG domain